MCRLILILTLVLSGCAQIAALRDEAARNEQTATVFPQNYRAEILSLMRSYLNDPRQVRDAFVSEPQVRTFDGVRRYVVCLRYNAKRSDGRYAGVKDNLVLFRFGRLERLVDPIRPTGESREAREAAEVREHCREMELRPFAELEKLS
ncbi:MAG TPA: hypothetical protein VNK48_06345 [Xanthobacteraceae bacterium]|nr:hypothetical protein [Xanthobacteraceae bacterium]